MKDSNSPITVPFIRSVKNTNRKISALTAYDYTFAKILDESGIDIILVGDSLSSIVQGEKTTLGVTLEETIYHSKCVAKGVKNALVIGDMPFLSYQVSIEQAVLSCGRLIKEAGVGAVKLEGGINVADRISALTRFDIPVLAHIGLTPQSYHRMGGHKMQGKVRDSNKSAGSVERLIEDAKAVEEAGAFCCVLEALPKELAKEITEMLSIPTIGIGAGTNCDGQILVTHDMLGINKKTPSFVKKYADINTTMKNAVENYVNDVNQKPLLKDVI